MSLDGKGVAILIVVLGVAAALLAAFYAVQASQRIEVTVQAVAGSPEAGREAILRYGCSACHQIPGIREPRAQVGPPLTGIGERRYLGGQLVNTPANMVRWIQDPQAFAPGTVMPNLGVTESEARDITAYLYRPR